MGKRVAEHFVTSPHQYGPTIHYSEVATWYGALTFASLTHDDALRTELIQDSNRSCPAEPRQPASLRAITWTTPSSASFRWRSELRPRTPKFLAYGQSWADRQWENPQPDGLSAETRYWIDDMYMLTILQLEAYRATGDRKYLDRDADEMVAYLDKLQQPNGLFYHAPDVPFLWGRGDGWVAAGMAEMLRELPRIIRSAIAS